MNRSGFVAIVSLGVLWSLAGCSGDGSECSYDTDCAGDMVCRNRKCVDPSDPCSDVLCDEPPGDASCYELPGACRSGVCDYTPLADGTACESDDACIADGVCHQGVCAGDPIECRTPPEASCTDDFTLRTYTSRGECIEGTCVYEHSDVTCAQGCELDHCIGEPCASVICDNPPDAQCYEPDGTCAADPDPHCEYTPLSDGTGCDDGDACTLSDACSGGSCRGTSMQCNTPPANTCDGSTAVIYDSHGTCRDGQCEYSSQRVDCGAGGCTNGQCNDDPCAGVICDDPPASFCEDGTTLRRYYAYGECAGGECNYGYTIEDCAYGCIDGQCCEPLSCGAGNCGSMPDGCGGTIDCGGCASGQWCHGHSCEDCADAEHCGPDCVDCSADAAGHACVDGACGCTSARDCQSGRNCNTDSQICVDGTEIQCYDGEDNDWDGATDCADDDCDARACDPGAADGSICYDGACRSCDSFICIYTPKHPGDEDPKAPPTCPTGCNACTEGGTCKAVMP
ncbi:MAG: hypothetical protein JXR96_25985 [Deltaproteobacteria bacterium]|nr:hypothetical protein [Deltaproteobacteria bacterium]